MSDYSYDPAACIADVRTLALYDLLRLQLATPLTIATPSAGNDWILPVPSGMYWEVLSVHGVLTASAVVANRFSSIQATDDAANIFWQYGSGNTQTANQAVRYVYASLGASTNGGTTNSTIPDPPPFLYPGWRLRSTTSNLDVGDQWTQVRVVVRQWSVGQVYWLADLLGRELGYEVPSLLTAADAQKPVGTGQPTGAAAAQ